jgi:hypothetical protein
LSESALRTPIGPYLFARLAIATTPPQRRRAHGRIRVCSAATTAARSLADADRASPAVQVGRVTLPHHPADASFDALRKELGDIAKRKDRSALADKVIADGFFWQREDSNEATLEKSSIAFIAASPTVNENSFGGCVSCCPDRLRQTTSNRVTTARHRTVEGAAQDVRPSS